MRTVPIALAFYSYSIAYDGVERSIASYGLE